MLHEPDVLVLGLGNRLRGDDAAGPLLIDRLAAAGCRARLVDGGTIGLQLLPEVQDAAALVAVDAANLGRPPGSVAVFEGAAMDRALGGRKSSAHEVALADLVAAAALAGGLPVHRALVAVQPARCDWGLEPSEAVGAAMPQLQAAVEQLLDRWGCRP